MQVCYIFILLALSQANPLDQLVQPADIKKILNITIDEQVYSGYLSVNDNKTAQFHYFFVLRDDSLPVTLWLNGGPGCSSAQGLFNENGPFNFIHKTSTLVNNKYSWSNVTNMLFIESPIGVGFSFGPEQNQTDETTAVYNLEALKSFYTLFPQFQKLDFYISGESYAGIYIPTLASQIIDYNALPDKPFTLQLKGIMIGNGCTDPSECSSAAGVWTPHIFEYLAGLNLMSQETYKLVLQNAATCYGSQSDDCKSIVDQVNKEVQGTYNFNPYNVFGDCPIYNSSKGQSSYNAINFLRSPLLRDADVPPCADVQGLYTWLQLSDSFKNAFHVDNRSSSWVVCSNINYVGDVKASFYLYPKLILNKLRIWKFSGDADAVVPITGTLDWLNKLQNEFNLRTLVAWRPWYMNGDLDSQRQNGGNFWKMDGITFVSVKGAGHMVPSDKRHAALDLFTAFIANVDLPTA